jgi:hypothetical protein
MAQYFFVILERAYACLGGRSTVAILLLLFEGSVRLSTTKTLYRCLSPIRKIAIAS